MKKSDKGNFLGTGHATYLHKIWETDFVPPACTRSLTNIRKKQAW